MKPERDRSEHSDRGLDLERLWRDLDDDPPGPIRPLPRPEPREEKGSKKPSRP
jgi:hypothetical protein